MCASRLGQAQRDGLLAENVGFGPLPDAFLPSRSGPTSQPCSLALLPADYWPIRFSLA